MKGNTRVRTLMSVKTVSPRVSTYVQTPQAHSTVHVDQATESSMASIVKTLMNVLMPMAVSKCVPTPPVVIHARPKKRILPLHPVSELNIFIDRNKVIKVDVEFHVCTRGHKFVATTFPIFPNQCVSL